MAETTTQPTAPQPIPPKTDREMFVKRPMADNVPDPTKPGIKLGR